MVFTEHDAGRHIDVRLREAVTVRLPESPSTGNRWFVALPRCLELLSEDSDSSPALGGSGTRTFELNARTPGTYELSFSLRRSFDPGADPTRELTYTLIVT